MISKTKIAKRASKKTDLLLRKLIYKLKSSKSEFWVNVARLLARPRSKAIEVNIKKLNQALKEEAEGEKIFLVPGKVLGFGVLEKPIRLACYKISNSAKSQLAQNGSELLSIEQVYEKNKSGEGIKLVY
ncbi:MAG: 50S ribosomal protein L18e [Candidatus Pacearchaeota archaeon]